MGSPEDAGKRAAIESKEGLEWPIELEVKALDVSAGVFSERLKKAGMKETFRGSLSTTWFERGHGNLPKGVSARIRHTVDFKGVETFIWTIKRDIDDKAEEEKLKFGKAKYELEGEAKTWEEAEQGLYSALMVHFPEHKNLKLEKTDTVLKERISFSCDSKACTIGECAGVRFDFDRVISFGNEEEGYEFIPSDNPLYILEMELITDKAGMQGAEEAIVRCAEKIGVVIIPADSKLSQKSIIRQRLGRK